MVITAVNILGSITLSVDGVDAVPNGTKLRTILGILALRAGSEVRREELIEELGLERTSRDAVNALHANVVRLRQRLVVLGAGPDFVQTTSSGYRLEIDRSAVDAHRFVNLVGRGIEIAESGAWSVAVAILEDALSLWRGDALSDALDGQVVASAVDNLAHWRIVAWETLLDAWIAMERYQRVIPAARTLTAESPLNESLRVRHITALRRTGRHAEAVTVYRDAIQVLHEELGVEPGPALRAAIGGDRGAGRPPGERQGV